MQRLGQWAGWTLVLLVWVSATLIYPHMTPLNYSLDSTSPRIVPLVWNIYQPEQASDGTNYRWSQPDAAIVWSGANVGTMPIASVALADAGVPVDLQIAGMPTMLDGARTISIILPPTPWYGQQVVSIQSPIVQSAQESRALGIRLRAIGFAQSQAPTSVPLVVALSTLWLALMLSSAVALLYHVWWWIGAIGAPIIVLSLAGLDPLFVADWLSGLALVSTIILSVIVIVIVIARRWVPPSLLAVTGIVYLFRLWGVMYPLFAGHDYPIHLRRVFQFSEGIWTLTANPYEFGRRTSVILPLYYRLADMLSQLFGNHLAMHVLIITSETALGIAVWLLVRRAGANQRTAIFAGIVTLLWPISSAVLWWSFMQQITAHVFTVLVAYAAVRRDQRGAYLAALFLGIVATMHIGEMMVAALWYGLLRLTEADIGQRTWWRRTLPVLAIVPFLLPLYAPFLQNLANGTGGSLINPNLNEVIPRMLTAVTVAWQPIPVLVAPVVIGIAVWRLKRLGMAWFGVGVTFWLVELVTQAQVRYLYTVTPLLSTGFAIILMPLWRKGYAGRMFVLCLVGFVAWVSMALWIDGVMGWQKPRIDGLTH
ncbi:MAG: hypothetical protein ACO3F2_02690 [Roseiflexaceae bacterium]